MGKNVSDAISVPESVGTCKDCYFWEDGRGGEARHLNKRKRKTCHEQGYKAEDRCESFHPAAMHPTCSSCKWFTEAWRGKTCQDAKRHGVASNTPANFHCENEYELAPAMQAEVKPALDEPVYLNGQPVHVWETASSTRHSILIKRGDTAILIEPGRDPKTVQLNEGNPIIAEVGGAFTYLSVDGADIVLDLVEAEDTFHLTPAGEALADELAKEDEDDGGPGSDDTVEEEDVSDGTPSDDEDDGGPGSDDDDSDDEDDGGPGSDDEDDGGPGSDDDDSDDEDAEVPEGLSAEVVGKLDEAVETIQALVAEKVPKDRAISRVARRIANAHELDKSAQRDVVSYLTTNA